MSGTENSLARRVALYLLLALLCGLVRLPFFLNATDAFDHEQAINGNLARDANEQLVVFAPLYQYMPFAHGPLIFGQILAPIYRQTGDAFWAIKLLGFVVTIAIFLVWVRVVRIVFGLRATWPFALVFLVSAPYLPEISTYVYANHYESTLFIGLILIALDRTARLGFRKRDALILGLACGIASYFCFQNLLPAALAAVLFFAWVPGGKRLTRIALSGAGSRSASCLRSRSTC